MSLWFNVPFEKPLFSEVFWSFLAAIMVILQRRFDFGDRKTKQRQLVPRIPQVKLEWRWSADVSVFFEAAEPGSLFQPSLWRNGRDLLVQWLRLSGSAGEPLTNGEQVEGLQEKPKQSLFNSDFNRLNVKMQILISRSDFESSFKHHPAVHPVVDAKTAEKTIKVAIRRDSNLWIG